MPCGKLIFFCGKMGAGKSTKSKELAQEQNAVRLSEDEWLASLYPHKIQSLSEYLHYSQLLKPEMKKLAQSILQTGTNLVMDFPANNVSQRHWFHSIYSEVNADHSLIFIDVPNELCLKRIAKRVAERPERSVTDTKEMFEKVTQYFVEPADDEGFKVTIIRS